MARSTGCVPHPWLKRLTNGVLLFLLAGLSSVYAQQTFTQGIYTCIDARGRKLTSDRPIPECRDREQQILNPSGTVRDRVRPTLTAHERQEQEAKDKLAREERALQLEEKRRDRALLIRYPSKAVHDRERQEAVSQIGVVRHAAQNRVGELLRQRAAIDTEMEFYQKDPSKAPPSVRRQIEEVAISLAVQERFIADQDAEIKRVNERFDEELGRLKQLWAMQHPAAVGQSR